MNEAAIKRILKDDQGERHSDFKIKYFMIGNKVDDWEKYKQCLLEMNGRYGELKANRVRLRAAAIYKNSFRYKIKKFYEQLMGRGELFKLSFEAQEEKTKSRNKFLTDELSVMLKIAVKLKENFGNITPEKRDRLEFESAILKAQKLAFLDLFTVGKIQRTTIDFINALPVSTQHDILSHVMKAVDGKQLDSKKMINLLNHQGDNAK